MVENFHMILNITGKKKNLFLNPSVKSLKIISEMRKRVCGWYVPNIMMMIVA